jgi:hypothetical protein
VRWAKTNVSACHRPAPRPDGFLLWSATAVWTK